MGTSLKSFEELECYQKARALRIELARLARSLPNDERYRLADQILRAARSITANIAEGFGRHHHPENLQFCRQARGSLTECLDHLNVALDEEFIDRQSYAGQRSRLEEAGRVLNGDIAYLQRCAPTGVPQTSNPQHDN